MTVSYNKIVANSKIFGFLRLLLKWKGSIYQLLYRETLLFLTLYYAVFIVYHFLLTDHDRSIFEEFSTFCGKYTDLVPLEFILGFYVSIVVSRWWSIFTSISSPDKLCMCVQCYIEGDDDEGRMIRRSVARYVNCAQVLVLRDISTTVKKRFPTIEHVITSGFFTAEEYNEYKRTEMVHHKFWLPLQWTCNLLTRAYNEGRIKSDSILVMLDEEVFNIRTALANLLNYDWISVPLVYTQVVTIIVYTYCWASLFESQLGKDAVLEKLTITTNNDNITLTSANNNVHIRNYFPLFTIFKFFLYVGWLKVAEAIIDPLGEDYDDFEVNYLIDRNLQVSYSIVDENRMKIPPLEKDIYWNAEKICVPHTKSSYGLKSVPHIPSASRLKISKQDAEVMAENTTRETSKEIIDDLKLRIQQTRSIISNVIKK